MHFLVIHKSYNHGCTLIVQPSAVQKKFKLVVPRGFDKERINWSLHCIHGPILTTYSCLLKSRSQAPTIRKLPYKEFVIFNLKLKTTNFKSNHLLNPTFHSTIDCIHLFSLKKEKQLFWLQFKYILMGQPIKLCTVANFINIHRFTFN